MRRLAWLLAVAACAGSERAGDPDCGVYYRLNPAQCGTFDGTLSLDAACSGTACACSVPCRTCSDGQRRSVALEFDVVGGRQQVTSYLATGC